MVETVDIVTGRYLDGIPLNGLLTYKINDSSVNGGVEIKLPSSYTSTLSQALGSNDDQFALLIFTIIHRKIVIDTLQTAINDPTYRMLASEAELTVSKGLKQLLLCKLLRFFLNEKFIEPYTSVIVEVRSYSCDFKKENEYIENYIIDLDFYVQDKLNFIQSLLVNHMTPVQNNLKSYSETLKKVYKLKSDKGLGILIKEINLYSQNNIIEKIYISKEI